MDGAHHPISTISNVEAIPSQESFTSLQSHYQINKVFVDRLGLCSLESTVQNWP